MVPILLSALVLLNLLNIYGVFNRPSHRLVRFRELKSVSLSISLSLSDPLLLSSDTDQDREVGGHLRVGGPIGEHGGELGGELGRELGGNLEGNLDWNLEGY